MSRSCGAIRFTTRSPIRIRPSETRSSPASIRSAVLLPQPDGPTSTTNSPSLIWRSKSFTATVPSKCLLTVSKVTLAMSSLRARARRQYEVRRGEKRVRDGQGQERKRGGGDADEVDGHECGRERDPGLRPPQDHDCRVAE